MSTMWHTPRLGRHVLWLPALATIVVGSALAAPTTTAPPTTASTAGVASQRGLVSFAILLVLIGGTLLYLRRRVGS